MGKPTTGSGSPDGKEASDMFVGVHERQLDPKGRVALPAAFRPRLEPRCYLALGNDKCVDVLTAEAFERVANDVMEKVRRGEMTRAQQRALAASAVEVTIDAQGRINIDEKLREYAGLVLDSRVIISGSFDRCEIWDPTRHQRVSEAGTQEMAGGAA
ncbi:MAG: cell division/cell wall cluster transcriptional repressor MraZ [Actinobacteria bacterium]|nr:cell division/cell wall cluster transcriptional repressor MraZ [Actinomycetota bacterium]NDG77083.1 cell division/cell wall cluster transcriptional repressor MraZ [Acidimicrobiia bacterium]